jgi:hypothetical protein
MNTTPIQNLLDLNDLEGDEVSLAMSRGLPSSEIDKYSKMIRNSHMTPPEAGMGSYTYTQVPQMQSSYTHTPQEYRNELFPTQTISCLDVASHVQACPVCSQLYKKDNIPYIVAIIILVILCIILIKKVLDV